MFVNSIPGSTFVSLSLLTKSLRDPVPTRMLPGTLLCFPDCELSPLLLALPSPCLRDSTSTPGSGFDSSSVLFSVLNPFLGKKISGDLVVVVVVVVVCPAAAVLPLVVLMFWTVVVAAAVVVNVVVAVVAVVVVVVVVVPPPKHCRLGLAKLSRTKSATNPELIFSMSVSFFVVPKNGGKKENVCLSVRPELKISNVEVIFVRRSTETFFSFFFYLSNCAKGFPLGSFVMLFEPSNWLPFTDDN